MTGTVPPSMTYSLPWIEAARSDLLGAARSADRDASERVHQRLAGGVLVGTCFFGQPSDDFQASRSPDKKFYRTTPLKGALHR